MSRFARAPQSAPRRLFALFSTALLLALSLSQLLPNSASAADYVAGDIVVITTNNVNLRSDAGTDGTIRTTLAIQTKLEVTDGPTADDGYTWYKVKVLGTGTNAGRTGWVAVDFVEPEAVDGVGPFKDALGARVTDGPVNVRTTASTNSKIKTTLDTGAEIPVYGGVATIEVAGGYNWLHILYGNGIEGWVATEFLEPLAYSPNLGSDDGWSTAAAVKVLDGPVNIRSGPSLEDAVVGSADSGSIFTLVANTDLVTADGYTWVRVFRVADTESWIAIDFLQPMKDIGCQDGACYPDEYNGYLGAGQAFVSDGPLNLRATAGTDGTILMQLKTGDYVNFAQGDAKFSSEVDGLFWLQVSVDGQTGWVAIDFLTLAS